MSALINAVNLYRLLGRPYLSSSCTCSVNSVKLSGDLAEEIVAIWRAPDYRYFSLEIECGIDTYDDESCAEALKKLIGKSIHSIELKFQRKSCYKTVQDFVQRCNSLNKGIFPDLIYISELDYLHSESEVDKPEKVKKIEHFCNLILGMSKVCHFVDSREETISKAVFIINNSEDKITSPVFVDLIFDYKLLEYDFVDINFINEIIELDSSSTHKEEKLSTLRLAIWETLSLKGSASSILSLVKSWDELSKKYHASYELYIRGFSFSKFQNEVHEYIIDNSNKANELLGGVANKIVIVPSLFGGWLLAMKQEDPNLMLLLGLVVIALFAVVIVVYVLENQTYILSKLEQSSVEKFELFKKKAHANPEITNKKDFFVDNFIETTNKEFVSRLNVIRFRLMLIRVVIWSFLSVMVIGVCIRFWQLSVPLSSVLLLTTLFLVISWFLIVISRYCIVHCKSK